MLLPKKVLTFAVAIIAVFILNVYAKDSFFITKLEYGHMLYLEPRGISCVSCHGGDGEETLIQKYKDKGKTTSLVAPKINNLSFNRFKKGLYLSNSAMPKYDLSDIEITMIFNYLNKKR